MPYIPARILMQESPSDEWERRKLALARFLNWKPESIEGISVHRFLELEVLMNYVAFFGA